MGNSISERILWNNEILIEILSMLGAEDQLALTTVHDKIEEVFLQYIWKRKFQLDNNIVEFDENFKALIEKKFQKLTTLNVKGGVVKFNPDRIEMLVHLTEINLNNFCLNVEDVYSMAKIAKNLEILVLKNCIYNWSESEISSCSTVKSLKKLQTPFNSKLLLLIENCPNLEELILNEIEENDIKSLNHSLLSSDIIKTTIECIRNDHSIVSKSIKPHHMKFEIIAKNHHATIVNIHSFTMHFPEDCEKFIEHFSLLHLKNVKELLLYFPGFECNSIEFLKLVSENCKELKTLRTCGSVDPIRTLNVNTLTSLRKIVFRTTITAENLFYILKDLSIDSCVLDWFLHYPKQLAQNDTYGTCIKTLTCYGSCSPEKNINWFFQLYPNGFQNLKELRLKDFQCIGPMLELALKHFPSIKYLEINCSTMNEKTETILVQFPLLKYLRIHATHSKFNQYQLEYLRNHGIIVIDYYGKIYRN